MTLHLSLINWGEIYYTVEREQGSAFARQLVHDIERLPILLMPVDRKRVEAAAHIKSRYSASYADAFAIALAMEIGAELVTGDPEFKSVSTLVPIRWLQTS